MLKDAASSAKPTKYAQNNRHGIYEGTMGRTKSTPERCSAPKTAKGAAKHKLLKTTILSRPRAPAISALAAHRAIRKSRMPAVHMETGVRENSNNAARMIVCMGISSVMHFVAYEMVGCNRAITPGGRVRCGRRTFVLSSVAARSTPNQLLRMCPCAGPAISSRSDIETHQRTTALSLWARDESQPMFQSHA